MLVELDKTVTRQNTTITNLVEITIDLEAKVTREGFLESRLSILEPPQVDNMPQTLPFHVNTASATHKSISSIHSSQHDTSTTNHTTKLCEKDNLTPIHHNLKHKVATLFTPQTRHIILNHTNG